MVAYCLQRWQHYLEGCLGGVTMVTDHQPLNPHHGPAGAHPGSNPMVEVGVVSIDSPTIKHQPGKANVVAKALTRSQCKLE